MIERESHEVAVESNVEVVMRDGTILREQPGQYTEVRLGRYRRQPYRDTGFFSLIGQGDRLKITYILVRGQFQSYKVKPVVHIRGKQIDTQPIEEVAVFLKPIRNRLRIVSRDDHRVERADLLFRDFNIARSSRYNFVPEKDGEIEAVFVPDKVEDEGGLGRKLELAKQFVVADG